VEEETLIEHQVDIFSLGMHLEKIGDTVGAIDSYRRARAEGRGSTRYRSSHRLATLLRKVGDREGAAGVWESLIREYPSHGPVAYEEFAKHLEHGTGDHGRALELVRDALETLGASMFVTTPDWPDVARRLNHRRRRLERKIDKARA